MVVAVMMIVADGGGCDKYSDRWCNGLKSDDSTHVLYLSPTKQNKCSLCTSEIITRYTGDEEYIEGKDPSIELT